MNDVDAITREFSDKEPWSEKKPKKSKTSLARKSRPGFQPTKRKQPTAGEQASMLAQSWYDRGEAAGFHLPYDVNYFALALDARLDRDQTLTEYRKLPDDRFERWVLKMIERWWEDYAFDADMPGKVTAANAKEFFLEVDWDDVRDYAFSCLRARYLMEHGTRRRLVVEAETPEESKERRSLHDELRRLEQDARIRRAVASIDTESDPPPPPTEEDRARLKAWRDRRKK